MGAFIPGVLVFGIITGASLAGFVALGYFAAFGFGGLVFDASVLRDFIALPGLWRSGFQTLIIALLSTVIGVAIALLAPATRFSRWITSRLSPLMLAIPHLSIAVALAFLLSPSGWIVRLLSPWATGFERPPTGFGGEIEASILLIFGLVVKEVPFLTLVALSQLRQIDEARLLLLGRSLGYSRSEAWLKLVLPQLYARMGPAIIAVLMFAVANIEMALPMGPTNPPTLAVMALDLLNDPTPAYARLGALASILLIGIGLLGLAIWYGVSFLLGCLGKIWALRGAGSKTALVLLGSMQLGLFAVATAAMTSLVGLIIWSIAGPWRFPQSLPVSFDFARFGDRIFDLGAPGWTTVWIAVLSTSIAMILAMLWLEYRKGNSLPFWLYLPLLIPQIAILAGLNFLLLSAGFGVSMIGVIAGHILFVLPYVIMVLGDGFQALDPRMARAARSLGHSRLTVLWKIKIPLLRPSLVTTAAIGFAVSVALYLPTIFAGGGRVATLSTEIIAISHGGDRRMMAAAGLILAILPLLALALSQALARPKWLQTR